MTIPFKGGNLKQEAAAYVGSIRNALGFDRAANDYKLGGKMPDGVTIVPGTDSVIALEVNYLSAGERPLRDADRNVRFIHEDDLRQARKYVERYEGGLLWVTNDVRLSAKYDEMFKMQDCRTLGRS